MTTKTYPPVVRPDKVQAIAIMNLVDGILNLFYSLTLAFVLLAAGVATFGLACLALPVAALPLFVGVMGIISGARLLGDHNGTAGPATGVAILQIVNILSGNVISLAVGVAALALYSDPDVQAYFGSPQPGV
jgi:hypothetical protein